MRNFSVRTRVNTIEATFERSRVNVKVERGSTFTFTRDLGRDPFNQNSNRSDREKRTTSKGEPVFSKLFRLDRTDPLSFGPKFPESLVEWIAPLPYIRDFKIWDATTSRTRWLIKDWTCRTPSFAREK